MMPTDPLQKGMPRKLAWKLPVNLGADYTVLRQPEGNRLPDRHQKPAGIVRGAPNPSK